MAVVKQIKVKVEGEDKILNLGTDADRVFVYLPGRDEPRTLQDLIEKGDIGGGVMWNDGGEF